MSSRNDDPVPSDPDSEGAAAISAVRLDNQRIVEGAVAKNADFWARVPKEVREMEPVLARLKWFDYRFTSVIQSNEHFLKLYQRISGKVFKQYNLRLNKKVGVGAKGTTLADTSARTFTSINGARATADFYGLPYEWFLERSIRFFVEKLRYDGIPRPNQLYSKKALKQVVPAVLAQWREWNGPGGRAQYSKLCQYAATVYRGDPHQLDHLAWLKSIMKRRVDKRFMLRSLWLDEQLMPTDWVEREFEPALIEDTRRTMVCSHEPPDWVSDGTLADGLPDGQFRPSCFGVPDAPAANPDTCGPCRFHSRCEASGANVLAAIEARHGSKDPVAAGKRSKAAERQRRSRARRRAALAARVAGAINPDDPDEIILVPKPAASVD